MFLFASGELYVIKDKMVVKVKNFVEDFSSEGIKRTKINEACFICSVMG